MSELDTHLEGLRELLHGAASEEGWRALCVALDRWPQGQEALALDYAAPHLSAWPDALRRPPGHWAMARAQGRPCLWWPLARAWHVLVEGNGARRINVIKTLRERLEIGLKEAKELTDNVPFCALAFAGQEEAAAMRDALAQDGAQVVWERDRPDLEARHPWCFDAGGALLHAAFAPMRDVLLARLLRDRRAFAISPQGAPLAGSFLRHQDLSDLDLAGVNLRQILWYSVDLQRASLRGADLRGAQGHDLDLRDADLQSADLRDALLSGGRIDGADLRGADLRGARLGCEGLERALLDGALIDGAASWSEG
jgi:hypothetical protein